MNYTIELTEEEVRVIIEILGVGQYKLVEPIITKLKEQIRAHYVSRGESDINGTEEGAGDAASNI